MHALMNKIEIRGTIAFALTGIYEARKKGMDIVVVYSTGMITAFGGGTLRDLTFDRQPSFWIRHYEYAALLLALTVVSTMKIEQLFQNRTPYTMFSSLMLWGSFRALCASLADQFGRASFISFLLGVITGVFCGVVWEIICDEVSLVFQRTELFATCAFMGIGA
jgi:uncharacterized membrane protein YeiH